MEKTTIARDERNLVIAALQNLPAPANSTENTCPFDYDKERLFSVFTSSLTSSPSVISNRQVHAVAFTRLYSTLNFMVNKVINVSAASLNIAMPELDATPILSFSGLVPMRGVALVSVPILYQRQRYEIPPQILIFCGKKGILAHLMTAVRLVENTFSSIKQLSFEIQQDPETEEEWITISVVLTGEIQKILREYSQYTRSLVATVPWPQRDLIRLAYDIQ